MLVKDTRPLVSVVTPTRDRLPLLRETLESVNRQSMGQWEHLIVDDGSVDGTADAIRACSEKDARIRYLPRAGDRSGANVCRNQGVAAAQSDLIVFLDSDDLLDPDCLARRLEVMERNQDVDFAVFRTGVFLHAPGDLGRELDAEMIGDDLLRFLYFEVPWQTSAPIWRRAALEGLGGFDEALPSWQDIDLHVRAIAGGLRYMRLPRVDHHMRWQEDSAKTSTLQRRSPAHLEAASHIVDKFEAAIRQGPGMTWTRQRALCSLHFFIAENWIRVGRRDAAQRAWRRMRERALGPSGLYLVGAGLLMLKGAGGPLGAGAERITHKWKGWARLRSEPELVAS